MMIQTEKEKALYDAASSNFKAGFNCAEAVFRAFCEQLQLNVTAESLKVAAGFGGGMYSPEGPCGTATGAVMVLGILAGRTDPAQDKKPMKDLSRDFLAQFSEKFGALSCGALNKHVIGTPEQKENCHAIIAETAVLLLRFIESNNCKIPSGSTIAKLELSSL